MDSDNISTGEMVRSIVRIEATMTEQFKDIKAQIVDSSDMYVLMKLYLSEKKTMEDKIEAQAESLRWFRRTSIAALIVAITPFLILAITISRGS